MFKCTDCKKKKSIGEFNRNQHVCKLCAKKRSANWYLRNRGTIKLYLELRRKGYPDGFRTLCFNCNCSAPNQVCGHHREYTPNSQRMRVLQHYSGNSMRCQCCGEDNAAFLNIDHISHVFGERKTPSSPMLLIRAGYPTGFRVLCFNCSIARGIYGKCPHGTHLTKIKAIAKPILKSTAGENNPSARLNWKTVKQIRSLSEVGVSQKKLADKFSVSKSSIHNVVNQISWKEAV